jgi:hypothetical protein
LGVEVIPTNKKKKGKRKDPRQYSPTICLFKYTQSSKISRVLLKNSLKFQVLNDPLKEFIKVKIFKDLSKGFPEVSSLQEIL